MPSRPTLQSTPRDTLRPHQPCLSICPLSAAWQLGVWIGTATIFASASKKPRKPGVLTTYIGSCIFTLSSLPTISRCFSAPDPFHLSHLSPFVPTTACQRVSAMTIPPAESAPGTCASSSISVSSAVKNMALPDAPPDVPTVPQWLPKTITPINPSKLADLLRGYNPTEREYLVKGFTEGFHIPHLEAPPTRTTRNHTSATDNPHVVDEKLKIELSQGRIAGPFQSKPIPHLVISPIGLVPKKDKGSFRLIHDLSFPKGSSVNDNIPQEFCSVHYETIDTVSTHILACGRGALVAKADIQDAFRICPIHPQSQFLLGFYWKGLYYVDRCLPMGASLSCQLFERFSTAIQWIMHHQYGARHVSHILDDFIMIGPPSSSACQEDLDSFHKLANQINLPLKHSKTCLPATTIQVHGLEVDTIALELRLPPEKLSKAHDMLVQASCRRKITLRNLQSLIGFLNFACKAVVPGRPFLRRLIDRTCGVKYPHHFVSLNAEARADIAAWLQFLTYYNGRTLLLDYRWRSSPDIQLFSDASGTIGFGAFLGHRWFAEPWPDHWLHMDISFKELFPIVIALLCWGHILANNCISFHTDNVSVVHMINSQTSHDPACMFLLRKLVITSMSRNILFKAIHVPGVSNSIADALSRLQLPKARNLAPWLGQDPTPLPEDFNPETIQLRPSWRHR